MNTSNTLINVEVGAQNQYRTSTICFSKFRMSTETSEEIEAIRVLPFSGQQVDWDEWSEKYQGIAAERGILKVMMGTERVPDDALNIDQKVDSKYVFSDDEKKQEHLARKMNQKGYRDLRSLLTSWLSNLFLW